MDPRPAVSLRTGVRDILTLAVLPLLAAAALPAAFASGGTRRWFGGRAESQRAEAQAAKDAAATAFYELDTAQRDLRISIETITAVDDSPAARRVISDFADLGNRIDEVSHQYITAVDAHDLDRDGLEASAAMHARTELTRAKDELSRTKQDLDRFAQSLGPLLGKAETQLARVAPSIERARQALLAASNALDAVRASGLRADELAARLAALGPELTKLNQGAGRHGVPQTLERAELVAREAESVRAQAERLPEQAAEIDHRLVSHADACAGADDPRGAGRASPQRAAQTLLRGLLAGPPAGAEGRRGERAAGRAEAEGGAGSPGRSSAGPTPVLSSQRHGPC